MHNRPRIQRALLRRCLRKLQRESRAEDVSMIQLTLDDETLFETVYSTAMLEAERFGRASGNFQIVQLADGSPTVDNLLKLLQWFIVNGPLLLEIIQNIISLVGSEK